MKSDDVKSALQDTLPVLAGYIVLGAGFGMIMNASGYGPVYSLAMSMFIFAGSMQYAAIGLFMDNVSLAVVALTTLVINARHLFYGISLIDRYKDTGVKKPYLIFALTDETYSIVCNSNKGENYCFLVSLFNQIYWVAGTVIGALAGKLISFNTTGLDFALTAMFITVFVDQWMKTKDHIPAIIGVLAAFACLMIFGSDNFLIPSMIIILGLLLLRMKDKSSDGKGSEA